MTYADESVFFNFHAPVVFIVDVASQESVAEDVPTHTSHHSQDTYEQVRSCPLGVAYCAGQLTQDSPRVTVKRMTMELLKLH